jgi:hypothetical protein
VRSVWASNDKQGRQEPASRLLSHDCTPSPLRTDKHREVEHDSQHFQESHPVTAYCQFWKKLFRRRTYLIEEICLPGGPSSPRFLGVQPRRPPLVNPNGGSLWHVWGPGWGPFAPWTSWCGPVLPPPKFPGGVTKSCLHWAASKSAPFQPVLNSRTKAPQSVQVLDATSTPCAVYSWPLVEVQTQHHIHTKHLRSWPNSWHHTPHSTQHTSYGARHRSDRKPQEHA